MTLQLLPWALLGSLIVAAGSFFYGMNIGADRAEAKQAKQDAIVLEVREAAQAAAAEEIGKIKVVNRTNETRLEREIVHVPDFSNCRAGADAERVLNDILAGKAGAEPAGGVVLPGTDPAP